MGDLTGSHPSGQDLGLGASRVDPDRWQPIETAPFETRVLLWCEDNRGRENANAIVFGRVVDYGGGDRKTYGEGMSGDWLFTHWMPLPAPPAA